MYSSVVAYYVPPMLSRQLFVLQPHIINGEIICLLWHITLHYMCTADADYLVSVVVIIILMLLTLKRCNMCMKNEECTNDDMRVGD